MITAVSILIFSIFDYFGYNLIGIKKETIYRIIQVVIQIGISLFLFFQFNLLSAISFNLLWWFGVADLLYYMIDGLIFLILKKSYENGMFWRIPYEEMTWLWFTPLGLLKVKMNKKILVIQSVIGILLTVIINSLWRNTLILYLLV